MAAGRLDGLALSTQSTRTGATDCIGVVTGPAIPSNVIVGSRVETSERCYRKRIPT
jgi:hypothetical protein